MLFTGETWKELAFEGLVVAGGTAAIATLYGWSLLLAAALAILTAGTMVFWWRQGVLVLFVVGGVVGSSVEIVCTATGGWRYAEPDFLRIPFWLPVAWGLAAVLVRGIADTFGKIAEGENGVSTD